MAALRVDVPRMLSEQVMHMPMNDESLKSRSRKTQTLPSAAIHEAPAALPQPPEGSLIFWRDLAQAGPEACADELTDKQLDAIHVPQPLDEFLRDKVRKGFSLVLTGNAGDGKTHLLRKLAPGSQKVRRWKSNWTQRRRCAPGTFLYSCGTGRRLTQ